jgi:hypothetical protein
MRNPERIKLVLSEIFRLWSQVPELRLMQLIGNCFPVGTDLYYLEDEELIQRLQENQGVYAIDITVVRAQTEGSVEVAVPDLESPDAKQS